MDAKPRYRMNIDGTLTHLSGAPPSILVDDLAPLAFTGQTISSSWQNSIYDGGKFAGGYGPTQVQHVDYWTLRARSDQLFNENLYARGIVRRLVTNEINTGLSPESCPDELLTGMTEDQTNDWSDRVETRFELWGKNELVCDVKQLRTFGAIQRAARLEALVSGDVLIVTRMSQRTRTPGVDLIRGSAVQTPFGGDSGDKIRKGHTIKHGVEFSTVGRIVAYWIRQSDSSFKRLPAFGEKSGKRLAWLVFGTDKRLDDVRGQPLLSLVLQSLKEIDRYRDATSRKAVINSMLAMFIKKTEDKPGTLPVQGGAIRRDTVSVDSGNTGTRDFQLAGQIPGIVFEELQHGEEPVAFNNGTDEQFGTFEESIIQAVAWCLEIPPEILRLSFSNNYSASQAAINEFKIAINRTWGDFGETFCSPIYKEWLLTEVLHGNIAAPGMLAAWRDPQRYDVFGAWMSTEWYGSIKPSTDMLKQVKASELLVAGAFSTRAREARVTTGTKWSRNVKRTKRENEQLADAMRPMLELKKEFGEDQTAQAMVALEDVATALHEVTGDG